ncbi:histidinol-phosphate transaminase [Yunchengibacter salinarum]|uniref:histidinol-phosphate transaminase n=1 Tax=Yunchengibacter salinarum TaxID=3133399 RepID=UPI0035B690E8
MTGPAPKDWILDLAPYVPGKARADGADRPVVKLSANESAYGPSPRAVAAARDAMDGLARYPDPESADLRAALGELHGLDAARILCGNGSDEPLSLLAHCFAGPGDEVIYSRYGFQLYAILAKTVGATGVAVANENWAASVDGILQAVTPRTRLIYLDNPNNPTGAMLPFSEIERLYAGLPDHVLLVLDAAYGECVDDPAYEAGARLVDRANNVVMTRTFSKMYALPALRVGWAYGPAAVMDVLNRARLPFNVSAAGQKAALAAVRDQDHLAAAVARNNEERAWLTAALAATGLDVVPSQTNFVLAGFPDAPGQTAAEAYRALMADGYILRHLPGQGLANHLRITIGTPEQNRAVAALLTAFMDGSGLAEAGEAPA